MEVITAETIGSFLPIWSIIPFVGMLLSIALFPLFKAEWWEKNQLWVAIFWALVFLIPFTAVYGVEIMGIKLSETVLLDYVPFIMLLLGLFVVAGGIHIHGTIIGSTRNNVILLAVGTILASWIGTTGAAMVMIRPVLRANKWRKHKTHVIVFFIFLVANAGGCLTPLGDPPLFLGFLRGVPFFWTLQHIWPLLLFNTVVLLAVFAFIDRMYLAKEDLTVDESFREDPLEPPTAADAIQEAFDERDDLVRPDILYTEDVKATKQPVGLDGAINIVFIGIIVLAVLSNGLLADLGEQYYIYVNEEVQLGVNWFAEIILILIAMGLSWKFTPKKIREDNEFEWGPIAEVAKLFIGIFITMIPALAILGAKGSELGLQAPWQFFWSTGALSSFLDNSPTYVVFLTCAGSLGDTASNAIATTVGAVDPTLLLAISAGAVFFGAVTYIGNAPNFMVKSIAESDGVKMPSFFGYMKWSLGILIPVFILDMLLWFNPLT